MAPTDQASAYCLHKDDYEDVARSNLDARTKIHTRGSTLVRERTGREYPLGPKGSPVQKVIRNDYSVRVIGKIGFRKYNSKYNSGASMLRVCHSWRGRGDLSQ